MPVVLIKVSNSVHFIQDESDSQLFSLIFKEGFD